MLAVLAFAACGEKGGENTPGDDPQKEEVGKSVEYVTTGDGKRLMDKVELPFGCPVQLLSNVVTLDPSTKYQTVDGFGCAVTGSTCYNLLKMSKADRTAFLKEVFDPEEGMGSSMIRVTIGSSDFGLDEYTWCDMPGIENFAMHALDRRDVIPVLKEILAINPDIRIVASPWSAPRWMKRNLYDDGDYYSWTSGRLKKECYQDYATYFVKWIQTMKAEGIDIYAMTIQNEPLNNGNSMSMYMSWTEQRNFIKQALGPAFEAAGIKTKILVFDHNYNFDDVADQRNYPLRIYEDPEAAKYVAGSAWHNYGGNVGILASIHGTAPDKEIYFTEASIGTWNYDFAKCLVEDFKSIFIQTMQNWGKGVTLWNLMLDDQKGPNRPGGCTTCFGAVTLSSSSNKVSSRNSHYYNVAHASKVIKQGAVRIATSGYSQTGLMYLAFQNPDGSYAVIASNSGSAVADVVFRSQKEARMIVPPGAIASMTWKD